MVHTGIDVMQHIMAALSASRASQVAQSMLHTNISLHDITTLPPWRSYSRKARTQSI